MGSDEHPGSGAALPILGSDSSLCLECSFTDSHLAVICSDLPFSVGPALPLAFPRSAYSGTLKTVRSTQ